MIANETVYLDYFHPETEGVLTKGLQLLFNDTEFSIYGGLWLTSNEASGLCNGECPDGLIQGDVTINSEEDFFKSSNEVNNQGWYQSYPDQDVGSSYFMPFIPG